MIRDVITQCNVSCNLSRNLSKGWDLFLNSEFLLAAQQKYCETSCKRDVTLCNDWMRCSVAAIVAKIRT